MAVLATIETRRQALWELALKQALSAADLSAVEQAKILCCLGRYDAAIERLSEPLERPDQLLVSGVALLSRGLRDDSPGDLVEAASRLHAGSLAAPSDLSLLASYGEALRHIHVVDTYRQTLSRQLRFDDDHVWRNHSRERLNEIDLKIARARRADEIFFSADALLGAEGGEDRVQEHPYLARKLVEGKLLGGWGKATTTGRTREAARNLSAAALVARVLHQDSGDDLLLETVKSIERLDGSELQEVATAFAGFQDGFERFRDLESRPRKTRRILTESASRLREAGVSFWLWAEFYAAALQSFADPRDATETWKRLRSEVPDSYLALRGHLAWRLGISAQVGNRPAEALTYYQEALELLESSSGQRGAAFSQNLIAHAFCDLGLTEDCWEYRLHAFEAILPTADHWQRHSALHTTVHSMVRMRAPHLALPFLEELGHNAERWQNRIAQTELYFLKARTLAANGANREAIRSVSRGRELLSSLSKSSIVSRLESDADIAEGMTLATSDSHAAHELLRRGFTAQQSAGYLYDRVPVLNSMEWTGRLAGDSRLSGTSRADLLNELVRLRADLKSPTDRALAGDVLQKVVEDAVAADVISTSSELLKTLDLLKPGSASSNLRQRVDACPGNEIVECVRDRLLPGERLMTFHLARDEMIVGMIDSGSVKVRRRRLDNQWVKREVSRFVTSLDGRRARRLANELVWSHFTSPGDLDQVDRLIIVPDRSLAALPFHALPLPAAEKPIIAGLEVVYSPSLSTFAATRPPTAGSRAPGSGTDFRSALLVASPTIAPDLARRFRDLEYAAEEVRSIALLFEESRVLSGEEASVPNVVEWIGMFDVVHFAVHAFDGEKMPVGGLVLSPSEGDPLGILDLQKLSRLELAGIDLLVLSGCSTGLGPAGGEAVLWSLPAVAIELGAGAVLATTKDVEDRAAYLFSLEFHRQLRESGSVGAAFARAARIFLDEPTEGRSALDSVWAHYRVIGG